MITIKQMQIINEIFQNTYIFFFDDIRKLKQSEHVVKLTRKCFFHLYIAKTYILSRNHDLRKLNKSKQVVALILSDSSTYTWLNVYPIKVVTEKRVQCDSRKVIMCYAFNHTLH